MPKVRAVDEMNETELRADQADRDFDTDFETACLEVPAKPVLSVTNRVNDR